MGRVGYLILIGAVLIGAMILIPGSPAYRLAADIAMEKMAARWGCEVVRYRVRVNPLSGRLTLGNLFIRTSEKANPNWRLEIDTAAVKIGYLAFIRNRTIDSLLIDGIAFRQEARESVKSESPGKQPPPGPASEETGFGGSRAKKSAPKKIRINRLQIRNGSFEYVRIDTSGAKKRITANRISVVRKNILLDKNPHEFFRSLLGTHTKF